MVTKWVAVLQKKTKHGLKARVITMDISTEELNVLIVDDHSCV